MASSPPAWSSRPKYPMITGFQSGLPYLNMKIKSHAVVKHSAPTQKTPGEPFPQDDFDVPHGRSREQLNRPRALFLGEQAHRDHRNKKQRDHIDVGQERPYNLLVDVQWEWFTLHLGLHRHIHDVAQGVPEEEPENDGKHDQQQVSDWRYKIAAEFLGTNNPDVSHQLCPPAATSAISAGASSPVSWRKISSRLIDAARSSFRSHPDSTTARAKSPRRERSFLPSTSKTARLWLSSLKATRVTPVTSSSLRCTAAGSRLPLRPPISSSTDSPERARPCRLLTESVATTFPLLMMMTCSHVWLTSGRMCVLRMMVWSPARLLIRSRVSLICFGSSPAVGSSRISTSGL